MHDSEVASESLVDFNVISEAASGEGSAVKLLKAHGIL